MNISTRRTLIGALLLAVTLLAALWLTGASGRAGTAARPTPLKPPPTAEPLVPTPLPEYRATALPHASEAPTATDRPTAAVTPRGDQQRSLLRRQQFVPRPPPRASGTPVEAEQPTAAVTPHVDRPSPGSERARVGAALALGKFSDYDWGGAAPGWYLNWSVDPQPVPGARFAQMVRVRENGFYPATGDDSAARRKRTLDRCGSSGTSRT